jgi:hypothetical protein
MNAKEATTHAWCPKRNTNLTPCDRNGRLLFFVLPPEMQVILLIVKIQGTRVVFDDADGIDVGEICLR